MDKELWKKISERVSAKATQASEADETAQTSAETAEAAETAKTTEAAEAASAEAEATDKIDKNEFFDFLNSLVEQPAVPNQSAPADPAPRPAASVTPTQNGGGGDDDISEEELASIISEGELNAKQLKSVLAKVSERTYKRTVEDLTRDLYPVMQRVAMNIAAWSSAATRFRQANSDLEPAMKFVAEQSNRIATAHPDWPPDKVYEEAGKVTRKAIEYFVQQQQQPKKPAFAPVPGAKQPAGNAGKAEDPNIAFMRRLLEWDKPQSTRV